MWKQREERTEIPPSLLAVTAAAWTPVLVLKTDPGVCRRPLVALTAFLLSRFPCRLSND